MIEPKYIYTGATFDSARVYRYSLWRRWDEGLPVVAFVMLNPSTADETKLDPTLRRCLRFAIDLGYGGFDVVNLFALRATDPGELKRAADPIGDLNDAAICRSAESAARVICAWGVNPMAFNRSRDVSEMLSGICLWALGLTSGLQPRHPLYMPADAKPTIWRQPEPVAIATGRPAVKEPAP